MRKPVIIDSPYPTAEDLARTFGIGKARMRRLTALAREFMESPPMTPAKTSSHSKAHAKKRVLRTPDGGRRQALKQG
jgi:hypothetical protein